MLEFLASPAMTALAGVLGAAGGLCLFFTRRTWERWFWLLFAVNSVFRLVLALWVRPA